MKLLFYILQGIVLLGVPSVTKAERAFGPALSFEWGSEVEREKKDGQAMKASIDRMRWDADIFFPIEAPTLHSTFYPLFSYRHELRRKSSNDPLTSTPDLPEVMASANYGLAQMIHLDQKNVIVMAAKYESFRSSDPDSAMYEAVAGIDFSDLNWFDFGEQKLTLLLRYRHYPHGQRWLPLFYYQFRFGHYDWDVRLPSQIIVGRDMSDGDITLFAGGRLQSSDYPIYWGSDEAWTEGYVSSLFSGVRWRLKGILHLELRGGVWSDTMKVMTKNGIDLEYSSNFQPWLRLALHTVVEN